MKHNMKNVKVIALLSALVLLLSLVGCGAKSGQKKAIQEAIANYSDAYIEVDDLNLQLRELMRESSGYEDKVSYTLDIKLPNYELADISALDYEVPAVNYLEPDSDAYLEDLLVAIRQSIDPAALMKEPDGTVPAEITLNLTLVEKTWEAEISAASMKKIQAQADSMMRGKLADPKNLPPEYNYVRVAEQKATLFETLISGSAYVDAITVTGVEASGGGEYRLNVSYPDPMGAYQSLGEQFVDSFTEMVFGSISCTLDLDDFDSIEKKPSMKAGSITVSMADDGTCTVLDGDAFVSDLSSAQSLAETAAAHSANTKWTVQEQARPTESTQLYTRGGVDSEFRFRLHQEAVPTYFRFYRVESSIQEAGILEAGAYVLVNNKEFTIKLSPGNYKIVVAWGDTWYGPEYMFGPNGNYMVHEDVTSLSSGYYFPVDFAHRWSRYSDFNYCDYEINPTP